jgi:hypothetical protein
MQPGTKFSRVNESGWKIGHVIMLHFLHLGEPSASTVMPATANQAPIPKPFLPIRRHPRPSAYSLVNHLKYVDKNGTHNSYSR